MFHGLFYFFKVTVNPFYFLKSFSLWIYGYVFLSLCSTINVPNGMIEAKAIKIKCFLNHGLSNRKTIINAIYAINRKPVRHSKHFTTVTSFPIYFKGTPTNSNSIYDKPSKKAMIRNIVSVFIV